MRPQAAHVHADFDGEHNRFIQVDIHGDTHDIPYGAAQRRRSPGS
jgi:hypothetical protein